MVQTIPRWEWRMFAKQIETRVDLRSFERTRHVESSEIYLVSAPLQANPKIRDGKLDIKTLESTDDNGLEQWKPDMKVSFPLSPDQVKAAYDALNLARPELDRDSYDLETFHTLIDGDKRAMAVNVNKVRNQYDLNGCTVEMSDVTFDGDQYQTVAAENTSQNLVWNIVELLGFRENENVNYIKFIKNLKGLS